MLRGFLDWILWGGKTCPNSGPHLLLAAYTKGRGRKKNFAFCLLAITVLWKVPLPCCWGVPLLGLESASSGFRSHKTSAPDRGCWDMESLGLNNWIPDLSVGRQPLLGDLDHSLWASLMYIHSLRSAPLENSDRYKHFDLFLLKMRKQTRPKSLVRKRSLQICCCVSASLRCAEVYRGGYLVSIHSGARGTGSHLPKGVVSFTSGRRDRWLHWQKPVTAYQGSC